MREIHRKSALLGLALGALLPLRAPAPSGAEVAHTTIRVNSADGGLTGEHVTEHRNLIGLVGDSIALSYGEHRLTVSAAHRYKLAIGLKVNADAARVTDYSVTPPPICATIYEVNWAAPGVFSTRRKKQRAVEQQTSLATGGLVLNIATPTFGAAQGPSRFGCHLRMVLGCQEQYANVRFASDPTGAEIWIGHEKQDATTPSTLSVPFCPERDIVHVMLRVAGMTTCPQDLKLSRGALLDVRCTLQAASLSEDPKTKERP